MLSSNTQNVLLFEFQLCCFTICYMPLFWGHLLTHVFLMPLGSFLVLFKFSSYTDHICLYVLLARLVAKNKNVTDSGDEDELSSQPTGHC